MLITYLIYSAKMNRNVLLVNTMVELFCISSDVLVSCVIAFQAKYLSYDI